MTNKVSSPAATGGAGTFFEQHVDAYWLAQLLVRAIPPILHDCSVVEVHFQTERLGWNTDDFLVVGENGSGSGRKLGDESRPAINAEQFYVSVSRGREQRTIYSDMAPATLREAIERSDPRKTATELLGELKARQKKDWLTSLAERMRYTFRRVREKAADAIAGKRVRERR